MWMPFLANNKKMYHTLKIYLKLKEKVIHLLQSAKYLDILNMDYLILKYWKCLRLKKIHTVHGSDMVLVVD